MARVVMMMSWWGIIAWFVMLGSFRNIALIA
jgi:hypothetical protein